jgi:hypothetical protein
MRAWHFVGDTLRDGRPVPADGVLGELQEKRLHRRIIRRSSPSLAHVTSGARQSHVLDRGLPAGRCGDHMIHMEHAAIVSEELKNATLGHLRPHSSHSAVCAYSSVPLGYLIPDTGRYIPRIGHAISFATWDARMLACKDAARDDFAALVNECFKL